MTKPCGCGGFNFRQNAVINDNNKKAPSSTLIECLATVHERVCVQAAVTITPNVTLGEIETHCVGTPIIGICPGLPVAECTFTVSQNICVQVPLMFSASAMAASAEIVCASPEIGACPISSFCTYSIGFFLNHLNFTEALIAAAGGSIVLGIDSSGLSFTVTAANAGSVLSLNTPSPPAPSLPPFKVQYQNLYAQLLAAKLNLVNGATCSFAVTAINSANTFLANSPPGGMSGAPAVQTPLAEFNNGIASGCPSHCPGE